MHNGSAAILIPLGALLLTSLALEALGRRTRLPRVTLLIVFGVVAGPQALGLIPAQSHAWYPLVADMALGMIGFLLGGRLTVRRMRSLGELVLWISLVQVAVTFIVVTLGLWALGVSLPLALVFGAIATATDPAATMDVIDEGKASGEFTEVLQGVVAIDDAWGLIVFSLALVAAVALLGNGPETGLLLHSAWELLGAILLGVILGLPIAAITGHLRGNRPVLVEALGAVFLCVGLARWLEVSYLLACVTLGCTVANVARHHKRPFHAVEDIERPFIIVFFVLSGAMLSGSQLITVGWVGVAYILLRTGGRVAGGFVGELSPPGQSFPVRWTGAAMLPQAGVAIAMALVAVQTSAQFAPVLPVVIASTVLFELVGPMSTRRVLEKVGDLSPASVNG